MKVTRYAIAPLLALTLVGCATGKQQALDDSRDTSSTVISQAAASHDPANLVPDGYSGRYQVWATVLQSAGHGPQLCQTVALSLPPQCGGPDIANWDWAAVAHEQASGTSWGEYLLTGTYDGTTFTLAGPVGAERLDLPAPRIFTTPCPEPPGGWRSSDPAKATEAGLSAVAELVQQDPDFGGMWVDQNQQQPLTEESANDPTRLVLNIRYTGDPAAHEAEIREVWGGALCLSPAARTVAELDAIHAELAGFDAFASAPDFTTGTVELSVLVAWQSEQQQLDQQYGDGVVRLVGAFVPLDALN